jgi:cytochrome c oxidase assembly protein subunit 11
MLGLAFASVPLYRLFCQVTGFGGTTQRADAAPGAVAGQGRVRFDANINPRCRGGSSRSRRSGSRPGERMQTSYRATNLSPGRRPARRRSTSRRRWPANISQDRVLLLHRADAERRRKVDMPVVFFVDPKLREDPGTSHIDEITLSYTFYPVETRRRAS